MYNGRAGLALLSAKANMTFDMIEQIASRQEFLTSKGIMSLVDQLYLKKPGVAGELKPGWSNTRPNNPGSVRRLVATLDQLSLTYDVYTMIPLELGKLLPSEFDRYRPDWLVQD